MNAKRNLYRGLMKHIQEHYNWKTEDTAAIHAALQNEERWKGVGLSSVSATLSVLRTSAGIRKLAVHSKTFKGRMPNVSNGLGQPINGKVTMAKKHRPLDVLITIPLPRKQTATLTYDEARTMHKMLTRIFVEQQ